MGARIAEEHPDLAVVDPPEGATVLAADACRVTPLLGEARVVEDEDATRRAELLTHEALQLADAALVIPGRVGDELLELAWRRPDLLRDVLDVLALDRQGEPDQVLAPKGPSLRAAEEAGEASVEGFERRQQGFETHVGDHARDPFPSGPPGRTADGVGGPLGKPPYRRPVRSSTTGVVVLGLRPVVLVILLGPRASAWWCLPRRSSLSSTSSRWLVS